MPVVVVVVVVVVAVAMMIFGCNETSVSGSNTIAADGRILE
jgi:hypothetical protein